MALTWEYTRLVLLPCESAATMSVPSSLRRMLPINQPSCMLEHLVEDRLVLSLLVRLTDARHVERYAELHMDKTS